MEGARPSHTADNLLDFFPEANRDGLNITWAHAVNSRKELQHALKGNCMMLETDIIVRGLGTNDQTTIPVNGHPPNTDSDITFEEWIDDVIDGPTPKGIKLDFKCPEAVEPTMKIMNQRYSKIHVPVLYNADIAAGPNSSRVPVESTEFLKACSMSDAAATMSLGFTTPATGCTDTACVYTWEMIFDILQKVRHLTQPITFPIRAVGMSTSWEKFVWLLGLNPSFTLTIWTLASDMVDMQGLIALRKHTSVDRVFFDLPQHHMEEFLKALSTDNVLMPPDGTASLWNPDLWYPEVADTVTSDCQVLMSTTGVAFLSWDSESTDNQKVCCKQGYDFSKTSTSPLEIQGTVHFIETKNQTDEETQLGIYIHSNVDQSPPAINKLDSRLPKTDLLAVHIGCSGAISCRTLSNNVSKHATHLPASQSYSFMVRNIGAGLVPMVKVTTTNETGDVCEESLECEVISLSMDHDMYVSFGKVGTSKDVLVDKFFVQQDQQM